MTPVQIPKLIDAPAQVAFWEFDELAPMVGLFAIGLMTNTLTYMLFLVVIGTKAYQRYKDNSRRGGLMALMHWHGLYHLGGRLKNGLERRFLG